MAINSKIIPVDFRIEIRDRSFNVLEILDAQVESLSFDYARTGGCGDFSFTLPRNYCDEKYISGDFNVRIYIFNEATSVFDLWYQGVVEEKVPTIASNDESIDVIGHGYQAQLAAVQIAKVSPYMTMEISAIVKDILDNYVVGVKDITYDNSDIESTGFTADSIDVHTDAQSIIQTLANIAGNVEWGVDANRKFYFKQRSTTPGFYFSIGANVVNFREDQSFKDIVNRVIVQGGDIAGTPYTKTFDDSASQLKYGRRDKVFQNSSITTDGVAQQFATSTFADFNDVVRKSSCDLVGYKNRIETTLPIPLFVLIADSAIQYGTKPYGTFLYSGLINRQINRIQYKIDQKRGFEVSLSLDNLLPDDADYINRLQYNVEQLRTGAL